MSKKIVIGSDHGGFALKEVIVKELQAKGVEVIDEGPDSTASCDYPVFAQKVCEKVLAEDGALGILICGTGLGMSMAANRQAGIRAAMCTNEYMASMCRAHNNANVLCMGERVIGPGLAMNIVDTYLNTEFEGDRHQRRIDLFDKINA
ncbi:MAG: ribose 5-phosphate isomerase B [Desulfovibrio sp.]